MGLSAGPTQAAAIARYRGDATLQGILQAANASIVAPTWNIFDAGAIRTGTQFPYLEVFTIMSTLGSGFSAGSDANDVYLQVTAFTRYGGLKQARDIMAQIYALTHGPVAGPFTLAGGFTNFFCLFENEVEQGPKGGDGISEQITHRYKFMNVG